MKLARWIQGILAIAILGAGVATARHSGAATCGGSQTWNSTLNPGTCNGHSSMFAGGDRGLSTAYLTTSLWSGSSDAKIDGYTSGGLFACGIHDNTADGSSQSVQGGNCYAGTTWKWTITY